MRSQLSLRGYRLLPTVLVAVVCLAHSSGARAGDIAAPVLKWESGGCFTSWCERGWYSSPAVADLDGDGSFEVIASAYSIVVLNGSDGTLQWRMPSGFDRSIPGASNVGRTWPGIVVADIDGDDHPEIATAHGDGWVSVYDHNGFFESGWPKRPATSELRGLAVHDLEGDGVLEVVVTLAASSDINTWVYRADGSLLPGWPQQVGNQGYAAGVYNDNVGIGDIDQDGISEILVPSDVHYICAYEPNGARIPAHSMYGNKKWGEVGIWESLEIEERGWGKCNGVRAESYRTNYAEGPVSLADMDGDGTLEIVGVGAVYDCSVGHPPSRYHGPSIWNADRSRFVGPGADWRTVPINVGAPLTENYNIIESAVPNPALADLDGDGRLEILFSSYDGRVHAFWLDKTEHGNWPYSVYDSGEGFFRFASEPVVADLDNDGSAEVLFTSWTQKSTTLSGHLFILDANGSLVHKTLLPSAFGSPDWNGAISAPTLANIDSDPDLEVVINTAHAGFAAYDLPGTANARVLWGTGRGSYQRDGSRPQGPEVFEDGFEDGSTSRWSAALARNPKAVQPHTVPSP